MTGAPAVFLIASLNANLMLGLILAGLGIGRIDCCPVLLGAVGTVVGTIGIVMRYAAIVTLGRLFTWRVNILQGHELVDRGLFRYVRHPSYTGGILAVLGCFLALGNGLAMAVFCLTRVPLLLYRIRIEEQVLAGHSGPTYRACQARTYRLFPLIY